MAPIPPIKPVKRTPKDIGLPDGYSVPDYWYEIPYNGRKLRYTLEIIGNQPPRDSDGYPLYIAMHGGGQSTGSDGKDDGGKDNDDQWNNMYKKFYRDPLANYYPDPPPNQTSTPTGAAVYVTIRGVSTGIDLTKGQQWTDDYNLHSRPEGQILVERLIVHLLAPFPSEFADHPRGPQYTKLLQIGMPQHFVDSNRVFLLGFSAGGNGAFELGTRLSDRFAAVVPGAGHPEYAYLANLANLPTFLQVGEDDAYPYNNSTKRFQRAQVYLANVNNSLDGFQNDSKYKSRPALYSHSCTVVKNADRTQHTRENGEVHYYWSLSDLVYSTPQSVLSKDYFQTWLKMWGDQGGPDYIDNMPKTAYTDTRVTPIPQIAPLKRKFEPPTVVWDLRGRTQEPDRNDPNRIWEAQRYSHWLYLRKPMNTFDATYQPEWAWVDYTAGNNALHIERPNDYIAYLLEQGSMLNLYAPIKVYIAGQSTPQELTVNLSNNVREVTQQARGDTKWQFSAIIYLTKYPSGWFARSAQSMAEVGPLSFS